MSEQNMDQIAEYLQDNHEFVSRVLAYGTTEAKGYALAVLANSGKPDDIEKVFQLLEELKQSAE
jgi:hypothetical protein